MALNLNQVPERLQKRLRKGEHSELEFRQLALQLQSNGGIRISDQHWRGVRYPNCFVARDLISWLTDALFVSRPAAVSFAEQMRKLGLIWHVTDVSRPLADEIAFYRVLSPTIINKLLLPSELWAIVLDMQSRNGPVPREHVYLGHTFRRCFPGREVVSWLVTQEHATNRRAAILIGQQLTRCGLLEHVTRMHGFHDDDLLYQYYDDFIDYSRLSRDDIADTIAALPGRGDAPVQHCALLEALKLRGLGWVDSVYMTLQLQVVGVLQPRAALGVVGESDSSASTPGNVSAPKRVYAVAPPGELDSILGQVARDSVRLNRKRPVQILGQLEAPRTRFDRVTWLRRLLFLVLTIVLVAKAVYLAPASYHTYDHLTRNIFGQSFDQYGFNIEVERAGVLDCDDARRLFESAAGTLSAIGREDNLRVTYPLRLRHTRVPARPCDEPHLRDHTCYYERGDAAAEDGAVLLFADTNVSSALEGVFSAETRAAELEATFVSGTAEHLLAFNFELHMPPDASLLLDIDPVLLPLRPPAPAGVDVLLNVMTGWLALELALTAYESRSRFFARRTNLLALGTLGTLVADAALQARLFHLLDPATLRAAARSDAFLAVDEPREVLDWQIGCVTSALFFSFFSLLKYLETNSQIATILISLRRAGGTLSAAAAVLLLLVMGFVVVFYCLMSNASSRYQTMTQSALTMLNFLIGKLDLRYFYLQHTILGSLVAVAYVIVLKLCLLNVIVSQVFTTYNSVAADYRDTSTRDIQSYASRRRRSLQEYATANFVVIVDIHNRGLSFDVVNYNDARRLYAEHHDVLLELEVEDSEARKPHDCSADGLKDYVHKRRNSGSSAASLSEGRSRTSSEDHVRRLEPPSLEDIAPEGFTVAPRFRSSAAVGGAVPDV